MSISDVFLGSQVIHERLDITSIFVCDPVLDFPEFLDDFISHYQLPP